MIVEIRGTQFVNKGAELMLLAIIERLQTVFPDALLATVPSNPKGARPYRKLANLGIFPKASLVRAGIELGDTVALVPKRLRERYGLVLDREIDVVLDASGFAYSDQWGAAAAQELERASRRWKRQGTRVILLPQAFGPFENPAIRSSMTRALNNADLVMPRDDVSFGHVAELVGERDTIRLFPDFTNLVAGTVPNWFDPDALQVAVVPNSRMLDKTGPGTGAGYVPFLVACIRRLQAHDSRPFLLVHEGAGDERLAERVSGDCGGIPIIREQNALTIKGILGACRAVVASRFHALVSALSQGVPSVATGWSHKYAELFSDYGFPEGVMSTDDGEERIEEMMARITDATTAGDIAATLQRESARLKERSREMWSAVEDVISRGRG